MFVSRCSCAIFQNVYFFARRLALNQFSDSWPQLQFPQPLLLHERYTFPELLAAYSSDYSPSDLQAYWRDAMAPEFVKDGKKSPVVVHVRVNWILGCITDLDAFWEGSGPVVSSQSPLVSLTAFFRAKLCCFGNSPLAFAYCRSGLDIENSFYL